MGSRLVTHSFVINQAAPKLLTICSASNLSLDFKPNDKRSTWSSGICCTLFDDRFVAEHSYVATQDCLLFWCTHDSCFIIFIFAFFVVCLMSIYRIFPHKLITTMRLLDGGNILI
jgi:hypothetical protein